MSALEESNRMFTEAWKLMAQRHESGAVEDLGGVTGAFANVALFFLNACILDGPIDDGEDLRDRLERAKRWAADAPHPWLLVLCEDYAPAGWSEVCTAAGFTETLRLAGMATDELAPPRRPGPDMHLQRVDDERTRLAVGQINCEAYGLPAEQARDLAFEGLWQDDTFGSVGSVGDRAVSVSAVLPVAGTHYVAMVATRPGEQKKGYAEQAIRDSIDRATRALGPRRTVLHASEAGFPLYQAMGYESHATYSVLMLGEPG